MKVPRRRPLPAPLAAPGASAPGLALPLWAGRRFRRGALKTRREESAPARAREAARGRPRGGEGRARGRSALCGRWESLAASRRRARPGARPPPRAPEVRTERVGVLGAGKFSHLGMGGVGSGRGGRSGGDRGRGRLGLWEQVASPNSSSGQASLLGSSRETRATPWECPGCAGGRARLPPVQPQ